MFKKATLICIGLCLLASPALAGTGAQPACPAREGTVVLATNAGLLVRVTAASVDSARKDNPLGGAVNTGGIARASTAVKSGGRVFLVASTSSIPTQTRLATVTAPKADTCLAKKAPDGLGTLLAKLFGLTS